MSAAKTPALEPAIIVIFGITGDLAKRYLLPALYHLFKDGLLHSETQIVGISRQSLTAEILLNQVEVCVNEIDKVCDPTALNQLRKALSMFQMDPVDAPAYSRLLERLNAIEADKGMCMNRLYYLSIPPQIYGPVVRLMGKTGLNTSCPHGVAKTRLLVEKPFGYDEASAIALIGDTAKVFSEEQIFRIDHYMAKETVQNILVFRFENPIFEALWNRQHITAIEINTSEQIGIEGRVQFYEPLGALRDFIQSHLLQLLAVVTMDQPAALDSQHIHSRKQAVLEQVLAVPPDQVATRTVRGQYDGYRQEVKNSDSTTETFAGIRIYIDSDRWRDVPIIIWTGKALSEKKTEIILTFEGSSAHPNYLRFRVQPNEGIELDLMTKTPGFAAELQETNMDFSYRQNFSHQGLPNAYEYVLVDAIRGDHTLFATSEEVLAAWRVVQSVLDEWAKNSAGLMTYPRGASGAELAKSIMP
jgi:glucose-6-phosphate 1-dehydrogenase